MHEYRSRSSASPSPWGPARIDALTMIRNRMTSNVPAIPENTSTPIAPVKPPFLWNAPQGIWTQWGGTCTGSARSQLWRDHGRVHAHGPDLQDAGRRPVRFERRYPQSPEDRGYNWSVWRLPSGRKRYSARSTARKLPRVRRCFASNCASCHNLIPIRWTEPNKYGKRFVEVGLVPQAIHGYRS